MANRTDLDAHSIHGTNPQNLVEKILRMKIYDSMYWKEHCFGLTAESLVDKAVQINSLGGTCGGARKPTHFICLILKLLQIQPDREIITEYIKNDEFKYVRILGLNTMRLELLSIMCRLQCVGAFYLRLVARPTEIYNYLEPLYNDYRKLRIQNQDGTYTLSHVDAVVDQMLHSDYLFDIALPRLPTRVALERAGQLDPWLSALNEAFKEHEERLLEDTKAAEQMAKKLHESTEQTRNEDRLRLKGDKHGSRRRSRSRDRDWDRRHRSRSRDRGHGDQRRERDDRYRDRDGDDRKRRRSRSHSRDRRRADGPRDGVRSRRADLNDPEVQEENERRAKLGLKPLR